ncbi:MAG: pyrroloquinoline quinone biosynthesis peptide chaperone PqqD [Aestuariivirgaceae bacterium]
MRERTEITPQSVPSLPPHVRLQFDDLRQKWVVLAPEKVLWPDDVSVDILKRCDGTGSTGQIVDALAREYTADRAEVEADVIEFIQDWSDRRLLQCRA